MDNSSSSSVGLTKVVLYKHGIGYFERRGTVEAPCKINLVCEASEIDDMLKSLLALSTGGRRIDAITYDSSKTLASRLAEFGFDISETEGLVGLLTQMKGIPVTVSVSGDTFTGRVVGLDIGEQIFEKTLVRDPQLTLYTNANSFKRLSLASISSIKVEDENMASEVNQQLELLFQNAKKKDRKALTVSISEEGKHELLIAYSIPCPIWKTSYRLVMHDESKTLLQGMAIVDNVQEEDWTDVQIVLVAASPISFIQPLYDPVQPFRPTIAAQGNVSSGPVLAERSQRKREEPTQRALMKAKMVAQAPGAAPAAAMMDNGWGSGGSYGSMDAFSEVAGGSMNAPALAQSMESAAPINIEAAETGEMFEYRVNKPVTIPRNSSALIPIVQQDVNGERISLYNEKKNPKFPFATVRFVNNTGLTLEGGPVTVMEGDIYAGEAMLDTVKPDDKRFLLYSIDQSCPIIVRQETTSKPYYKARAINGVIIVDCNKVSVKTYEIENLSDKKKIVFVEHPVNNPWKLINTQAPEETTEHYYRFKQELEAKSLERLHVTEQTDAFIQIWISEAMQSDENQLNWLMKQNFVNQEFKEFLKKLLLLRNEILSINEKIGNEQNLRTQYIEAQTRARENLKTLGANNERYRKIIDTTEDQITEANNRMNALAKQRDQKAAEYRQHAHSQLETQLEELENRK